MDIAASCEHFEIFKWLCEIEPDRLDPAFGSGYAKNCIVLFQALCTKVVDVHLLQSVLDNWIESSHFDEKLERGFAIARQVNACSTLLSNNASGPVLAAIEKRRCFTTT